MARISQQRSALPIRSETKNFYQKAKETSFLVNKARPLHVYTVDGCTLGLRWAKLMADLNEQFVFVTIHAFFLVNKIVLHKNLTALP